ncbi:hypothetical protein BHM03_00057476 [Ensete ventricosum]|nr:hypothetical protein BHM03_00057476 [Ensete ventricosum]
MADAEKHPGTDVGASLRKRSRRAAPEEPANTFGSTTEAPAEKGRERRPTDTEVVVDLWVDPGVDHGKVAGRAGVP